LDPSDLLKIFKSSAVDYLLVEGLHKQIEGLKSVDRVICAKTRDEASELIKIHPGKILFVTGRFASGSKAGRKISDIPILSLPRDNTKALSLIGRA
jgi:hypothetical protein